MKLHEKLWKLQDALRHIAALADTGSKEHKEAFGQREKPPAGWRVAERMREAALDALGEKA